MQINPSIEKINLSRNTAVKTAKSKVDAGTSDKLAQTDSVQLSHASLEAYATDAPFNAEKIASIKLAIQQGEYKINAQAIADKLLQLDNKSF